MQTSVNIVFKEKPQGLCFVAPAPSPWGLHARVAACIVKEVSSFAAHVTVEYNGKIADAAGIVDLLMLGAPAGARLCICATGDDAAVCLARMAELFFTDNMV